jgi:hypothetical protein
VASKFRNAVVSSEVIGDIFVMTVSHDNGAFQCSLSFPVNVETAEEDSHAGYEFFEAIPQLMARDGLVKSGMDEALANIVVDL